MHVCVAGQDEPTVILLSSGRVGASVLELKSLWPRFATFSREAVVEYPGYCGSGDTDALRTTDAIAKKVSTAVLGSGLLPPYLQVGHLLGGLNAAIYT